MSDGANKLSAQPGEMRATIQITRKATGKVETYEIIGHPDPEKLQEILNSRKKEHDDGSHP